jgi:hypothetical protein
LKNSTKNQELTKCTTLKAKASDNWQTGSATSGHRIDTIFITGSKSAENLTLPKDVTFEIGGTSPIKKLVLQIHFGPLKNLNNFQKKKYVGVDLYYYIPQKRPAKKAGVLSLHAGGLLLPKSKSHLETSCKIDQKLTKIWPIAFLGHTHDLGTQVSLWKVNPQQTIWNLLAKINPQLSQIFRPIIDFRNAIMLKQNDILALRCSMTNTRENTVITGATRRDEMCALYLLYYTNSENDISAKSYCMGGQIVQ